MGWHAFPVNSWDEIGFNQPAYMRLFTGNYSVPTFQGKLPHADVVFAYYDPLYVMIRTALFYCLGFNRWTSTGIDMGVHLLVSGIFAAILWRVTRNGWLSGLFWLGMTAALGQVGRSEEYALLLGTLAVVAAGQRTMRWLLGIALLGATGAVSPLTAVLSTIIVVIRLALAMGWRVSFVWRAAGVLLLAPAVSLAIFCWHIYPYYREAWQQFFALPAVFFREPLGLLLADFNIFGLSSLAIFGLLGFGLTARLFADRHNGRSAAPTWLEAVGCLLAVSVVGVVLANVAGRPSYDYRWLAYLWSAVAVVTVNETAQTTWSARRGRTTVAVGLLVSGFALANRDTARYCAAPILWRADSVTYADAAHAVNRIVPKDATVGGDAGLWMAITDGRPFLAIKGVGLDYWPEYLISSTLDRDGFQVLEKNSWRQRIQADYEEIPVSWPPAPPNHLSIGKVNVPVFRHDADWRFRVWKRKTASPVKGN